MSSIDEEIKSRFTSKQHKALLNIMFTAAWMRGKFLEELSPFDISPEQYNILRILRGAHDWRTMNDVKSRMVEKSPNTTRMVDKLLCKELVERKRSEEDRRVVYVRTTEKGLKLLQQIDEKGKTQEEFMDNLTDKEASLLSDLLDKLRE